MTTRRKPSWRTGHFIVVCPLTGARLCKDRKWRNFANFGTHSECVRIYKYLTPAEKAGERYRIKPAGFGDTVLRVIHMYDGDSMDAAGNVTRANDREAKPLEQTRLKRQTYTQGSLFEVPATQADQNEEKNESPQSPGESRD